jgi:hypothetical protein
MIGDLVRFVNVEEREVKIVGRIKQFMSLVGEHLSLDNLNCAVQHASVVENIPIPEFCLYADTDNQRHMWFIGTNEPISDEHIKTVIDEELKRLNDDYAGVRKYSLNEPVFKVVSVNTFYEFLASIGKAGSQNKMPRVMNLQQTNQWNLFLKKKGL